MIVKAEVIGSSSSDPRGEGRVTLRSTGYWEESLRIPVVGNVGLNSGDIVFVDVSCRFDHACGGGFDGGMVFPDRKG